MNRRAKLDEDEKVIQIEPSDDGLYMLTDKGNVFRKYYDEDHKEWVLAQMLLGPFCRANY